MINEEAKMIIAALKLEKHIEGGYFYRTYQSTKLYKNNKSLASSIYFMITADNSSFFHAFVSDEILAYHAGSSAHVFILEKDGIVTTQKLGINFSMGERPQVIIPAGTIFAIKSIEPNSYSLLSCFVTPEFSLDDLKIYTFEELSPLYPEHQDLLRSLTLKTTCNY